VAPAMRALRGLRSIPRQSRLAHRTSATAAAPAAATVPASPIAPRSDYSQTGFVPSIDAPFDGAFNAEGASILALPACAGREAAPRGAPSRFLGRGVAPAAGKGKKFRAFRQEFVRGQMWAGPAVKLAAWGAGARHGGGGCALTGVRAFFQRSTATNTTSAPG